jgi:hypothetical protein
MKKKISVIITQNFLETCIQYLLLYIVYEKGFFVPQGYLLGCANLSFKNYLVGGEYAKFIFWSIPTYFIQIKLFKTDINSIGVFIGRNAIISLCIHTFFSLKSNFKYIRCSSILYNNIIHILEIFLAGLIMYCVLKIIIRDNDKKQEN